MGKCDGPSLRSSIALVWIMQQALCGHCEHWPAWHSSVWTLLCVAEQCVDIIVRGIVSHCVDIGHTATLVWGFSLSGWPHQTYHWCHNLANVIFSFWYFRFFIRCAFCLSCGRFHFSWYATKLQRGINQGSKLSIAKFSCWGIIGTIGRVIFLIFKMVSFALSVNTDYLFL